MRRLWVLSFYIFSIFSQNINRNLWVLNKQFKTNFTQTDVDECSTKEFYCKDATATCNNTIGSYDCVHKKGFVINPSNNLDCQGKNNTILSCAKVKKKLINRLIRRKSKCSFTSNFIYPIFQVPNIPAILMPRSPFNDAIINK